MKRHFSLAEERNFVGKRLHIRELPTILINCRIAECDIEGPGVMVFAGSRISTITHNFLDFSGSYEHSQFSAPNTIFLVSSIITGCSLKQICLFDSAAYRSKMHDFIDVAAINLGPYWKSNVSLV